MAAMVSSVPASIPPGEYVPLADQRIVLHGLTWADFQALLVMRGERRYRMAYLDGAVEIMGASRGHEGKKSMIGCLLEHYCLDRDIPITPYGSWHLEKKSEEAAAEPDECYVFAADPKSKEWPDLAIEVVWTSGGINKPRATAVGVDAAAARSCRARPRAARRARFFARIRPARGGRHANPYVRRDGGARCVRQNA